MFQNELVNEFSKLYNLQYSESSKLFILIKLIVFISSSIKILYSIEGNMIYNEVSKVFSKEFSEDVPIFELLFSTSASNSSILTLLCENNIYDEVKVSHVCVISGFNGKMCAVLEKLKP